MKKKIYSYYVQDKIKARIPPIILAELSNQGWNAMGIYEVVKEELEKEKKDEKNCNRKLQS